LPSARARAIRAKALDLCAAADDDEGVRRRRVACRTVGRRNRPVLRLVPRLVGIGLLLLSAGCSKKQPIVPELGDIRRMTAELYNSPKHLPDIPEFEVPAQDISKVLESLTPVRPDPRPKLYQGLGMLKIEDRTGRAVTINLYWTELPSPAFAIDGKYYRGGRDEVIEDAIRVAYADAGKPAAGTPAPRVLAAQAPGASVTPAHTGSPAAAARPSASPAASACR
jgi:hypothetical protein